MRTEELLERLDEADVSGTNLPDGRRKLSLPLDEDNDRPVLVGPPSSPSELEGSAARNRRKKLILRRDNRSRF